MGTTWTITNYQQSWPLGGHTQSTRRDGYATVVVHYVQDARGMPTENKIRVNIRCDCGDVLPFDMYTPRDCVRPSETLNVCEKCSAVWNMTATYSNGIMLCGARRRWHGWAWVLSQNLNRVGRWVAGDMDAAELRPDERDAQRTAIEAQQADRKWHGWTDGDIRREADRKFAAFEVAKAAYFKASDEHTARHKEWQAFENELRRRQAND